MAEIIEKMRFSPPHFLKDPWLGVDFGGSNADFSKISAVTLGFYHFSGGDIFNIAEISAASKNRGVILAEKTRKCQNLRHTKKLTGIPGGEIDAYVK